MLIEFRVANYRSIKDEQVLSMEAVPGHRGGDDWPRESSANSTSLLPAVALYGANASGKSNVLSALNWMRKTILDSHRRWEPSGGVPITPFAWGDGPSTPSLFEISFIVEQVKYQYGFSASHELVLEEWLYAWPNKRKQVWFERDKDEFKFGAHLQGHKKLIEDITRPNSLFISAAAQQNHPQLSTLYDWFEQLEVLSSGELTSKPYPPTSYHWLEKALAITNDTPKNDYKSEYRTVHINRIVNLLFKADTGIRGLEIKKENDTVKALFKHKGMDSSHPGLPFHEESSGTQAIFLASVHLFKVLDHGGVLGIDELETNLHPLICQEIIRTFNDPKLNPRNAQLIFTTHDTMLLGTQYKEPALRRDQVWFTEKDDDGATTLTPLSAYKPRKGENLERGYLQGRYGGVPYLNELFERSAEVSNG